MFKLSLVFSGKSEVRPPPLTLRTNQVDPLKGKIRKSTVGLLPHFGLPGWPPD